MKSEWGKFDTDSSIWFDNYTHPCIQNQLESFDIRYFCNLHRQWGGVFWATPIHPISIIIRM